MKAKQKSLLHTIRHSRTILCSNTTVWYLQNILYPIRLSLFNSNLFQGENSLFPHFNFIVLQIKTLPKFAWNRNYRILNVPEPRNDLPNHEKQGLWWDGRLGWSVVRQADDDFPQLLCHHCIVQLSDAAGLVDFATTNRLHAFQWRQLLEVQAELLYVASWK